MTPMEGSKCLLYLRLGWKDDYFRLLDRALEQEDPLSPLTLELALCGGNTSEAQSVLRNDPGVSSVSEDEILEWAYKKLYGGKPLSDFRTEELDETFRRLQTGYDLFENPLWTGLFYHLEIMHYLEEEEEIAAWKKKRRGRRKGR